MASVSCGAPCLALQRAAKGKAAVDIGEVIGLNGAITGARAQEDAQRVGYILLGIECDPKTVLLAAHRHQIGS
jgi:hypothetical protein